jgi:hypothetical protein
MTSNIATGPLMTLVAYGLMNSRANIRHVAYGYQTFYNIPTTNTVDSSTITLGRYCDIVMPECLEFIMNANYSREEFLTELKKTTLTLKIASEPEIQFPLNLLINLSEPTYCDNKIYVKTHFETFFGNIPHLAIQYNLVQISLSNFINLSQFIERFGLMCKLTFLDTEERHNMAQNDFKRVFQELSWIEFNMRNIIIDNNIYNFHTNFESVSKGFFIECNNINNLSEIQLLVQDSTVRFCLNKFLIQTKCVKINENMLYFPFNADKSYTDTSTESYEGGINFSRIDNPRLILKFTEPINNIKIYNVGSKIFEKFEGTIQICDSNPFQSGIIDYNNQSRTPIFSSADFYRIKKPNYKEPIVKLIDGTFTCPIACEDIGVGAKYLSCHQCKNNFSEIAIKKWIESKKTCPTCRVNWNNFQIYINGEADVSNDDNIIDVSDNDNNIIDISNDDDNIFDVNYNDNNIIDISNDDDNIMLEPIQVEEMISDV